MIPCHLKKKKKNQLFPTCVLFFWLARYWEVIFTGIIQTERELSDR